MILPKKILGAFKGFLGSKNRIERVIIPFVQGPNGWEMPPTPGRFIYAGYLSVSRPVSGDGSGLTPAAVVKMETISGPLQLVLDGTGPFETVHMFITVSSTQAAALIGYRLAF